MKDKMKRFQPITVSALVFSVLIFLTNPSLSDVVPGDVIDGTNWEKVRGLVPDSIMNWVKEGKIVLNIGELSYDDGDYIPRFVVEWDEKNVGKYALADDHWVVEKETGKRAEYLIGSPFPTIDPDDPKAGEKLMYNHKILQGGLGDMRINSISLSINQSGYERKSIASAFQTAMEGNPKYLTRVNPEGFRKQQMLVVKDPYDMAGMAVMTWRFRDPSKQDTVFAYAPAIRRVRRMSPANRSDALFGSDLANDDVALYDGKITAMEWKLLRKQEALLPFSYKDPGLMVQNKQGEWETTDKQKRLIYGYEKEGWQGAPWAPLDWVWVKRPTYIVEMKPKDRYYNYGVQRLWVAAVLPSPSYKIIHDRSGKYWKTIFKSRMVGESSDGSFRLTYLGDTIAVDERSNHATIQQGVGPDNIFVYFADTDLNLFSLAGFQKYCK